MAEPSTHINYSFEDIQRYLQGKMNAAEMHAVEKAALQDPFLADAIEGFTEVDFTTANQHLNEINASLFSEKQKSKVVAINNRMRWLNIAAVIIVLAGIGVVVSYFFQSSNKQLQIAQVKNEPAKNEALKDSATIDNVASSSKEPDTTLLIAENKPVKKPESVALRKEAFRKDIKADKIAEESRDEDVSVAAAPVLLNRSNQTSVVDTMHSNLMASEPKANISEVLQGKVSGVSILPKTVSGKVIDEHDKPITSATIKSADGKTAVVTDMNGNFSIHKSDTVLNVVASTVGYDSKNVRLKSGYNQPIVLEASNDNLNEVVVVGYGRSKKMRSAADSAMPVGGWQNFNHYVFTQLNKDTTTNPVRNHDDLVEMEFLIDNNGNPYNIKITKALDDQRNEKAVKILKSGPKWTNTSKKKKVKVSITF
jgi:carboxypeptidase-like protein